MLQPKQSSLLNIKKEQRGHGDPNIVINESWMEILRAVKTFSAPHTIVQTLVMKPKSKHDVGRLLQDGSKVLWAD